MMALVNESLLTKAQKRALEALSQSASRLLRRRAQILLLYDYGKGTPEVAAAAGISAGRARYWKRQFLARGMEIFSRANQPAGKSAQVRTPEPAAPPKEPVYLPAPDVPETLLLAAALAPAPERASKTPPILPTDNLAEAGRKVFAHFFNEMLRHEDGTRQGEDIEELHDMRVATRRLRVAMDLFGPAFEPKPVKRHLKGLRAAGRALGQVRDLDVLIEKTEQDLSTRSGKKQRGLAPLLSAWQTARDAARLRMLDHINGLDYWDFKRKYARFVNTVGLDVRQESAPQQALTADTPICKSAQGIIAQRLAAVRAYHAILPNATFDQMHQLRIEIKKLRYTLEFLAEILPPETPKLVRQVRIVQDHLGEINDARVACLLIGDFLQTWEAHQANLPLAEWQNPQPVASYLAEKQGLRHELAHSFMETWTNFHEPALQQQFDLLGTALDHPEEEA